MAQNLSFRTFDKTSYICQSCCLKFLQGPKRFHSASPHRDRRRVFTRHPSKLPDYPARTRFAPSPTGYLHLGSLRTALFNYLLAKRTGGQFVLRIEDTDQKRTLPDAEGRLYEDLRWAGLEWDEGPQVGGPYGPYKQSERSRLYREHADKLLQSRHVYRCFCPAERLNSLARERNKIGLAAEYDRTCARLSQDESDERASKGEPYTVRLKVPDVYPEFEDLVYGKVGKNLRPPRGFSDGYEDPVLLKSDGLPTYHLANVIDDHLMNITHVIRGTEWLQATAKHMVLYEAFGWTPPQFAHVGLLVNEEGQKLSKRNLDLDISHFRDRMEIFPEALTNFAALLGWSHTEKSDVLPMEELVLKFSLKFTKGNTAVSLGKLWFLQSKYALRRVQDGGKGLGEMVDRVTKLIEQSPELEERPNLRAYVQSIIMLDVKNYLSASQFLSHNRHFFTKPAPYIPNEDERPLSEAVKALGNIPPTGWNIDSLRSALSAMVLTLSASSQGADSSTSSSSKDDRNASRGTSRSLYSYLRKTVMDGKDGMGVVDAMHILGREETLRRLDIGGRENSRSERVKKLIDEAENLIADLEAPVPGAWEELVGESPSARQIS